MARYGEKFLYLVVLYLSQGELRIYLLYLDESGNPSGWQVQNHFVFGGVAVHERRIFRLTQELDAIQDHYFPNIAIPVHFHATDIRRGKGRFKDLDPSQRQQILSEIYDVIYNTRFPGAVVFATAMHISAAQNPMQVRRDTLEDICQRFNTFLMRLYKSRRPNKGLLIIDRHREDDYRNLVAEFQDSGTKYGYIGNIADIPYFARAQHSRMLQLADHCANAVFRYYERNDDIFFNKLLPRFDRRKRGAPPDGLKHIIDLPCLCPACSWRRR